MADMNEIRKRCVASCRETHELTLKAIDHCLREGGKHAEVQHVKLLTDCARICETALDFMLRESKVHRHTCGACAEVCDACARSCREVGGDLMERCARQCAECSQVCREMVQAMAPA